MAAGHHDQVQAMQGILVMAKTFANQPFQAVAIYGPAGLLPGDGKTQPGSFAAVGSGKYGEVWIGDATCPLEDLPELAGLQQTGSAWKSPIQGKQQRLTEGSGGRGLWRDEP